MSVLGALRRLWSRDRTANPPPLPKEARDTLQGVFTRARITPDDEDWKWGAAIWAQGARDPAALDRFLATRLQIKAGFEQ